MPGHYRQVEAEKGNAATELQEFDKRNGEVSETLPLNFLQTLAWSSLGCTRPRRFRDIRFGAR